MYEVTFIVKKSGERVTVKFDSPWECRKRINRIKHGKSCILVSHSNV